jgi:hypothetical protein
MIKGNHVIFNSVNEKKIKQYEAIFNLYLFYWLHYCTH